MAETKELKEGQKAPDFTLPGSRGKDVSLKGLKGKNVVLYFYPKDDTPGCTVEACEFKAKIKTMENQGAVVLGISKDDLESHNKFIEKFGLPFELISDVDTKICQAYGVWREKQNYGKTYMGIVRTTFIIDKAGKIARIFEKVKPEGHAEEVLQALKSLN